MTALLRWTGLPAMISFYRYFAFDLPRLVTGAGVTLILGVGAIRLYLLVAGGGIPAYLQAYFAVLFTASLIAATGMAAGRRWGWLLGSFLSIVSIGMYVASRTPGLPGLHELVGRWDYPLGTFAVMLAAGFVPLHFTVLTGMNVAVPDRRSWHD